ncbi:DUF6011 domain-containing protein [Mycolicibacillus parakoreensis]|uniref:DUF6011 domain-containing protein n=1 Tax=Mycolicibacillus parakoreensis TaxID=1069221 RepID=UPI003898F0CF
MSAPRKVAGGPDVATRTAAPTAVSQYIRRDGYAAPTADERLDAWIIAEAARLGYRLSCRCLDCKRWLADPVSIAAMRGPTCRRRAEVAK